MVLAPYDPNWPRQFRAEAELLRAALGTQIVRIEHVGSTSVPGLAAKPVIDIQISVPSLERLEVYSSPLESAGYSHVRDPDPEFERVYPHFRRPAMGSATHHIHLCIAESDMEQRHLAFRDYLRDHEDVTHEYAQLKLRLAAAHGLETREARERYTLAKGPFIESVIAKAIAAGYPKP